jgi:DNA (cytosine-5)-methyltransferase 1
MSEIDPAACAVLAHYHPDTPNLGDIKAVTEEQIKALGKIDLVVFGFPCQDLSVAGKRAGLKDEDGENTRSGLFFDAMRIVRWSGARWAVAENVPGLFSSEQGRDFAAVVGEMAGVRVDVPDGGWENSGFLASGEGLVEWAVLDAQFFGVPQRRRRVFIIRDTGDWQSREPVLLERDSLQGHPPPRKEKGKRVAGCLKGGSGSRGWSDPSDGNGGGMVEVGGTSGRGDGDGSGEPIPKWPAEIASTLDARYGKNYGQENQHINSGASHFVPVGMVDDTYPRLRTQPYNNSDPGMEASMLIPVAFTQNSRDEVRVLGEDGEVAGSLSAEPGTHQTTYLAFDPTQVTSKTNRSNPQVGDPCHTLAKGAQPPAICIKGAAIGRKPEAGPQYGEILEDDSTYTLNATEQHAVAYGCYDEQTPKISEDIMPTLRGRRESGGEMQFVAYEPVGFIHPRQLRGSETSNQVGIKPDADISDALTREGPGAVSYHIQDQNTGKSIKAKLSDVATCLGTRDLSKYQGTFNANVIQSVMQVRRLTPVECSRLQGVPDVFLNIMFRGKPLADGLKYKLLGNGFAVPVVNYIGRRIAMVEELINGIS